MNIGAKYFAVWTVTDLTIKVAFFVSGPDTEGEGEFKMIQFLRKLPETSRCVIISGYSLYLSLLIFSEIPILS